MPAVRFLTGHRSRPQVFRVKGSGTPVQCASSDLSIDPVTGHIVLRQATTTADQTTNFDNSTASNRTAINGTAINSTAFNTTVTGGGFGRKLLSGPDSADSGTAAGRSLLQTSSGVTQPAMIMSPPCTWHSSDFYSSTTGKHLQGVCSQFPYSTRANVPMIPKGDNSFPNYWYASVSYAITSISYVQNAAGVKNAFCYAELYRVSFGANSSLDFCFLPWPVCSRQTDPSKNGGVGWGCCNTPASCPTKPFVNYANFKYDNTIFDLPCHYNKYGQVGWTDYYGNLGGMNDACLKQIGNFGWYQGDPLYRLSSQLPIGRTRVKESDWSQWFPYWTTTTDDINGNGPYQPYQFTPAGRKLSQAERELLVNPNTGTQPGGMK